MTPAACLTPQELEDLLEARLPAEQLRRLDRHLLPCSACIARLDRLARQRERAELPGLTPAEPTLTDRTPLPDPVAGETEPELPAGLTVGPYDLVREIGRGGMGVVYEAKHRTLDRT